MSEVSDQTPSVIDISMMSLQMNNIRPLRNRNYEIERLDMRYELITAHYSPEKRTTSRQRRIYDRYNTDLFQTSLLAYLSFYEEVPIPFKTLTRLYQFTAWQLRTGFHNNWEPKPVSLSETTRILTQWEQGIKHLHRQTKMELGDIITTTAVVRLDLAA
ncbi:hypothetical protein ACJ72_03303 [Emergomyces africanus]|uniref:Uncharacterized protein n=1 Tax=Emergomyces africanus TaxID=1955775 RepID=A0A1B7P017_9EURO|nr:hypothetical protein ACJ72_03303 [Emergomyces africanus]